MTVKAYLIGSLQVGRNTRHEASTADKPNVIDLDDAEFARLEAMGAVRKATEKEIKIGYAEDAVVVKETPAKKAKAAPKAKAETTAKAGDNASAGTEAKTNDKAPDTDLGV